MKRFRRTRLGRLLLIIGSAIALIIADHFLRPATVTSYPRLAIASASGKTIHPVYFRQRPVLNRHFRQGALVFPTPPGRRIDTLVYTGAEGPWRKQLFILKRK